MCNLVERKIPILSSWYYNQFCNCRFVWQKNKKLYFLSHEFDYDEEYVKYNEMYIHGPSE